MELASRWLDRKLSWLEGVVAWLLIVLLIGLFSRYMLIIFSKTEKIMIERTVININSAINYTSAIAKLNNDIETINSLVYVNPMNFMSMNVTINELSSNSINQPIHFTSPPSNYKGEVLDDADPSLERGNWYFDVDGKFLFYKLRNDEFFETSIAGPERIRFKVKMEYIDLNKDNRFDSYIDEFISIKLEPVDSFRWSFN